MCKINEGNPSVPSTKRRSKKNNIVIVVCFDKSRVFFHCAPEVNAETDIYCNLLDPSISFDALDKFLIALALTVSQIGYHLQDGCFKLNILCKETDYDYYYYKLVPGR